MGNEVFQQLSRFPSFGSQTLPLSFNFDEFDKFQSLTSYVWNAYVHDLLVITQLKDCQGYQNPTHQSSLANPLSDFMGPQRGEGAGEIRCLEGFLVVPCSPKAVAVAAPKRRPTEMLPQAEFNIISAPEKEQPLSFCHLIINQQVSQSFAREEKMSLWTCEHMKRPEKEEQREFFWCQRGLAPSVSQLESLNKFRLSGLQQTHLWRRELKMIWKDPSRWMGQLIFTECIAGCYVLGMQSPCFEEHAIHVSC